MSYDKRPYIDMKERQQAAFDEFSKSNCIFAFNQEQLDDQRGKIEDGALLIRFAPGCLCKEDSIDELTGMMARNQSELRKRMEDPGFAEGAFLYELENHEYGINCQGDWDVAVCFTDREPAYVDLKGYDEYLREDGYSDETISACKSAEREYFREAEEGGWF